MEERDLIRRVDAISALGEEPDVWFDDDGYEHGLRDQWRCDVNAINTVPSAQTEKRTDKRTETHPCDNQYCIQNGGDICDHVHCPIGQKQTFYDDITDEQEQLDFVQKHEKIPVVIKAETHGDTISRTAAIDSIMEEPSEVRYPVFYAEKIRQMPSARRKGKWIYKEFGGWHCSECDKQAPFWCFSSAQNLGNFCQNCGAQMERRGI